MAFRAGKKINKMTVLEIRRELAEMREPNASGNQLNSRRAVQLRAALKGGGCQ